MSFLPRASSFSVFVSSNTDTLRTLPFSSMRNASFCRPETCLPDLSATMTGTRTKSVRAVSFANSCGERTTGFPGAAGAVWELDRDGCCLTSCWPKKGHQTKRSAASKGAVRNMEWSQSGEWASDARNSSTVGALVGYRFARRTDPTQTPIADKKMRGRSCGTSSISASALWNEDYRIDRTWEAAEIEVRNNQRNRTDRCRWVRGSARS